MSLVSPKYTKAINIFFLLDPVRYLIEITRGVFTYELREGHKDVDNSSKLINNIQKIVFYYTVKVLKGYKED